MPTPTQKPLLEKTLELLRETDLTAKEISTATGINYHWVAGLRKGQFTDPGVNKVEVIYNFLAMRRRKGQAAKKGDDQDSSPD